MRYELRTAFLRRSRAGALGSVWGCHCSLWCVPCLGAVFEIFCPGAILPTPCAQWQAADLSMYSAGWARRVPLTTSTRTPSVFCRSFG